MKDDEITLGTLVIVLLEGTLSGLRDRLAEDGMLQEAEVVGRMRNAAERFLNGEWDDPTDSDLLHALLDGGHVDVDTVTEVREGLVRP